MGITFNGRLKFNDFGRVRFFVEAIEPPVSAPTSSPEGFLQWYEDWQGSTITNLLTIPTSAVDETEELASANYFFNTWDDQVDNRTVLTDTIASSESIVSAVNTEWYETWEGEFTENLNTIPTSAVVESDDDVPDNNWFIIWESTFTEIESTIPTSAILEDPLNPNPEPTNWDEWDGSAQTVTLSAANSSVQIIVTNSAPTGDWLTNWDGTLS